MSFIALELVNLLLAGDHVGHVSLVTLWHVTGMSLSYCQRRECK
jgi:hypothetical protein